MFQTKRAACALFTALALGIVSSRADASSGTSNPDRYQQAITRLMGQPAALVTGVPETRMRTFALSEVGADADLPPGFGPLSSESASPQTLAPGCSNGYYFWLSNDTAVNLFIDYIRIDDPVLPPGGPYFFAQNLVIAPFSVVQGYLVPPPGFCATRLEVQYNYNASIAKANQKFYHNFAYYSFAWKWFKVRNLVPGRAVAYFNTSGLYPPPQVASIETSGPTPCQNPWTGDTSCDSPFTSWDVDLGSQVGFVPGLSPGGLIFLGMLLLFAGVFSVHARARQGVRT